MNNDNGAVSPKQTDTGVVMPLETRAEMLRLSARGYTQLRHVLVQLPDEKGPRASTLARVVSQRKHRALVLYMLLLACWPWLAERREPVQGDVWIRALTTDKGLTWTGSTLSRAWADLETLGLVERKREERLLRVVPRREDGADSYDPPRGRTDRWNAYFILPDSFWMDELFATLSLPALAMLLVVAKETNAKSEVWLTYEHCEEWYGIKPQSVQKGLKELEAARLLHRRTEKIKAPLSPTGWSVHMWYSLTGEFGYEARKKLRKRAASERQSRLAKTNPKNTPKEASA